MGPGWGYLLKSFQRLQDVTSVVTKVELIIEAGDWEDVSKHWKWTWAEVHVGDQCAVHHTRVKLSWLMLCSDATITTMPQTN